MRYRSLLVCFAVALGLQLSAGAWLVAQQPPTPAPGARGGAGGGQRGATGRDGGSAPAGPGRANPGPNDVVGSSGPPPAVAGGPVPRRADGTIVLGGATPADKGIWLPQNGGFATMVDPKIDLPFQDWARAVLADREKNQLEPHTRCKPSGGARQFLTPYGVEIVDLPEAKRVYIFDIGGPHTYRSIALDRRTHPAKLTPQYYGDSVGWWEGDTLVVDTVGFNESFWIDRRGTPTTNRLHTIERFTRTDSRTIKYEIEVDDPGAYTKAFTAGFNLSWEAGTELFEYVCQQGNEAPTLMLGEQKSVDRSSAIVP
jgi:hypothetical protein